MNIRRIATIALSYRDFDSLDAKLDEACRWVSLAACMGCDLAVLPETLNLYCGDGPGNPRALKVRDVAMDDWQSACRGLINCAIENRIAVTAPVYVREGKGISNCFYLVSATGQVLGRYVKTFPAPGEGEEGVVAARGNTLIEWSGLKVGGAICYDTNFPEVFTRQRDAGADLFLCPSLTPGGDQVNYFAATLERPIVIAYPAWSRIIDILGHDVVAGGYRHETLRFGFGVPIYVADVNFDKAVFHDAGNNCAQIETILRRYGRKVKIEFDQDNCRYALESVAPDVTVKQIAAELDLLPTEKALPRTA